LRPAKAENVVARRSKVEDVCENYFLKGDADLVKEATKDGAGGADEWQTLTFLLLTPGLADDYNLGSHLFMSVSSIMSVSFCAGMVITTMV